MPPVSEPSNGAQRRLLGARVVLYHDHLASASALREALERDGYLVRVVSNFQDAAVSLMHCREPVVLVIHPPATDTFRRAVLDSVRRVAPSVPIVGLVAVNSPEVQRDMAAARAASVLSSSLPPADLIEAIAGLLAKDPLPQIAEEDASQDDAP